MKDAFVELVRELRGTVRARRQEKIREVELAWSASELAGFRLFVMGLHPAEMVDVCHALSDAQAVPLLEILGDFAEKDADLMRIAFQSMEKTPYLARAFLAKRFIVSIKPEVRARACGILANCGAYAEPLLGQALADPDASVQLAAIEAVADGAFKKLGGKIVPILRDEDKNTRYAALSAVARLGISSPSLSDSLVDILLDNSQEERTRRLAGAVLARETNKRGRVAMLEALRDPRAGQILRLAAAESLSAYDDMEAIKAVLSAVDDQDANIAKTARMSLSRKQSQKFADILAKNLADADTRIAELSAEILGGLDVRLVESILIDRLKIEHRIPVINALALAMSKGGIPGTWNALIAKLERESICSPAFFHALADVAEEDNLPEFASLFDKVVDAEARHVILERLALFARTSRVAPQIEALAVRILNGPDTALHILAATVLAHVTDLDLHKTRLILERLAGSEEDQGAMGAITEMLNNKGGALADLFLGAPPQTALFLAWAASHATCIGEKGEQLFSEVAQWARSGCPHARDALKAMAFLAPSALAHSMANCGDQIFLIEAWSGLPEQDRIDHYPDLHNFFAQASPADALAGIRILKNLQDSRSLKIVADVAFTYKYPVVRKAARDLTRELVLAP